MATHVVTGAFGYSGKFLTHKLLNKGIKIKTLTNSLNRQNPFGEKVEAIPFNFDRYDLLCKQLENVDVLYNTYWVRFNNLNFTHNEAVENTKILFNAARDAGVKRIVHVSITNPNINSDLEYFRGKAILEESLKGVGIPYSIVRPAVLFGSFDILINNIAWTLRKLPVIGIFGDGKYRLQPIHVEDFADILLNEGFESTNRTVNAIGQETYTYSELLYLIAKEIGVKRIYIHVNQTIGYIAAKIMGCVVNDTLLTKEEIEGLMRDLLYVEGAEGLGKIKLSEWVHENADTLGIKYANELGRRRNKKDSYEKVHR